MYSNTSRSWTLGRTLAAAAVAVGINATLLGGLLTAPTRGEVMLASNPVAMPMLVGSVTLRSLKAGAQIALDHAGRDWRHAERNIERAFHHGAHTIGATLTALVDPTAKTC